MNEVVLAIAGLTVLVWLLLLVARRPMGIATAAFVVAFVAQTEFGLANSPISRVPILALFGLAVLFAREEKTSATGTVHGGSIAAVRLEAVALVALLGVSFVSTTSVASTVEGVVATAAALFVGVTLGRFVPTADVLDRLFVAAAIMVVASVLALGGLGTAWEAGRMRGVFENANGLGSACMIAAAVAPRRWALLAVPVAGVVLVASGSRASGLGLLVVLLLRIEWRPATRIGAALLAPVVIGALALLSASAFSQGVDSQGLAAADAVTAVEPGTSEAANPLDNAEIFRTRDNRTAQWEQGIDDIGDHLPLGTGFGTATFEYSNSPISLAVQVGLLAAPILAVALLVLVRSAGHPDRRVRALLSAMLAHSMFEGWMFAFGSFSAIVFWTVLVSASAEVLRNRSATDTIVDLRPAGLPSLPVR